MPCNNDYDRGDVHRKQVPHILSKDQTIPERWMTAKMEWLEHGLRNPSRRAFSRRDVVGNPPGMIQSPGQAEGQNANQVLTLLVGVPLPLGLAVLR